MHPSSSSWSIHGRREITGRYSIHRRIGSGTFSDVYLATRISDSLAVALKEVHDHTSAVREIDALQLLRGSPNVIQLLEYFWHEDRDDDAVLVLEFIESDLESVIRSARRSGKGMTEAEVKGWMVQIVRGVEEVHRCGVVHRDLKPGNLLVSKDGVLKVADFGQARILQECTFVTQDNNSYEQGLKAEASLPQPSPIVQETNLSWPHESENLTAHEPEPIYEADYLQEVDGIKGKYAVDDTDKDTSLQDGDTSCLATCSTGDIEEDYFNGPYSYEAAENAGDDSGALTSCAGTRWFRAPELLYGSTSYGQAIDLWSLGCILGELLSLQPLFPGTSDIDQFARIIGVLGDMNEETWPGCSKLPDYGKLSFNKVENPTGLEACLPSRSAAEVNLLKKLICYDPARRVTAMELLNDKYFTEEPLPVPLSALSFPYVKDVHDESSSEWGDSKNIESDSDMEEFGNVKVVPTEKGFSIRF